MLGSETPEYSRRLLHLRGVFCPTNLLPRSPTFHRSPTLTLTFQLPAALKAPLGVSPFTFDSPDSNAHLAVHLSLTSEQLLLSEVRTPSLLARLRLHILVHVHV